jgi:hypothetical protein
VRKSDYTWEPLEIRTYKYKNPKVTFFCPLCRTKRAFVNTHRLTIANYVQISLITLIFVAATYPLMELRGFPSFFVFWGAFELGRRVIFRKDIPCPHCGFDASWYKKNVPIAKRLVDEFWQKKSSDSKERGETAALNS